MDDEGDPAAPLVRARQRGEPHPPKTPGRERISGLDRKTDSFGGGRSWFGHGAVTSRLELGG